MRIKIFLVMALIMLGGFFMFSRADGLAKDNLTTVDQVDLSRYLGLWYEYAKIPNKFQKKCAKNTTAHYTLREDGRIDVVNRCEKKDGEPIVARGIARIVDKESKSKLKVSFVKLLGINLFWGKYWIIGLADDYRYALVGEPSRKYGWVLSRKPELSNEDWEEIRQILINCGYRPSDFIKTAQE